MFSEASVESGNSATLTPFLKTTILDPPGVVAKLRGDIRAVLPESRERFEKTGGEVWDMPEGLEAFVAAEHASWTKLIREAGIKLD